MEPVEPQHIEHQIPDEQQSDGATPPVEANLRDALIGLTNHLKESSSRNNTVKRTAKTREPDTFYGSDPSKLKTFLMQCNLNFIDRPDEFQSGRSKVLFALSFLRGIAQNWFEPGFANLSESEPDWLNDYDLFVQELRTNFGPYDATGEAETGITKLRMKDSARIATYIVEFNAYAALLEWGDAALRHRFYEGLPTRLKDDLSRDGKPVTLAGMRIKAQQCDARYWERKAEINRETTFERPKQSHNDNRNQPQASTSRFQTPSPNKGKNKPFDNRPRQAPYKPPSFGTSNNSSSPSKSKNDLTGKIGKDGKLTAEERQRRRDNGLCLWCGTPGHTASNCTLNTSKARAVKTEKPAEPVASPSQPGKA